MVTRRSALRYLTLGVSLAGAGCSQLDDAPRTYEGRYSTTPSEECQSSPVTNDTQQIIEQGSSDYVIVPPSSPSDPVSVAASELQSYLEQVTGVELPISPGADTDRRLELVVDADISSCSDPRGEEAFGIDGKGETVRLVGGSPRGVLYAVYDLLERDAGVRWLAPGPDGEVVPSADSLSVSLLDGASVPAFKYRVAAAFDSEAYQLWAVRNKLHVADRGDDQLPAIERRDGYVANPEPHSFYKLLPPEEYRPEHPEWYSENQLDVTKEAVRDAFVDAARTFLDENPDAEMVPVTPNDGYGWPDSAHPDRDLAAQKKAGQALQVRHHPSVSEAYFEFVADVATRLESTHPSKYVYALAYVNYVYPPVRFADLPDNVIVSVAHYAPADYSKPIADGSSEPNVKFSGLAETWSSKSANSWLYAYTVKYALDALPFPIAYRLSADIEYIHDLGYTGFYSQGAEGRWGQYGPHFYVMAKKLWSPSRNVDDLLATYFEGMAGQGEEAARAGYDTLADALAASVASTVVSLVFFEGHRVELA